MALSLSTLQEQAKDLCWSQSKQSKILIKCCCKGSLCHCVIIGRYITAKVVDSHIVTKIQDETDIREKIEEKTKLALDVIPEYLFIRTAIKK